MTDTVFADALAAHGAEAYLLTVGQGGPHTSFVTVRYEAGRLSCMLGKSAAANIANVPNVSVFWPPLGEGGYGIIVDGRAEDGGPEASTRTGIRITKAVLHRAGPKPADGEGPCPSDCRPLTLT